MADEIINRVANSTLVVFDLEDFYPEGERFLFDIKDWLYEGLVLREKEFRDFVKNYNWEQHKNQYVAITCSTDAIIPAWAYMLISIQLQPFAKEAVLGNLNNLETALYQNIIDNLEVTEYKDKPVIIKGCSKKGVPESAYIMISNKLKPVAKSILFGEACSSVPLYKRR
jgi:hypothetical protein